MAGLSIPQGGGFWEKGRAHQSGAMQAYGNRDRKRKTKVDAPDKTAGGGLMAAAGMGVAGSTVAAGTAVGGPAGAAIGAGVGMLAYYLS